MIGRQAGRWLIDSFIDRQTDRQKDRQRQTGRQTDRQIDREIVRLIDAWTHGRTGALADGRMAMDGMDG